MLWKQLTERPFCIYGTGIVAMSVYTALKILYGRLPLFFLISAPEGEGQGKGSNSGLEKTDGIPVKSLAEWKRELAGNDLRQENQQSLEKGTSESTITIPELYFVATPEVHHASIVQSLRELQIEDENIFLLTNKLENDLMEMYYSSLEDCHTVKDILLGKNVQGMTGDHADYHCMGDNAGILHVYQAKSHMDKPLHSQDNLSKNASYIFPIQVGAALTDQMICGLRDNTGDNISVKNRNYCELTATYYAWKHSNALYKGICHYRRIFDITDGQMKELLGATDNWDVILPYPSVHYPDISVQHVRYVKKDDWNAMKHALKELEPEYLRAYEESISSGEHFFYNYNMLIAKTEVFDDYCSFLFRILEQTEGLTTPKGRERADRFAGYLGENLTTIYFLKNRNKWKYVYAGKIWMI